MFAICVNSDGLGRYVWSVLDADGARRDSGLATSLTAAEARARAAAFSLGHDSAAKTPPPAAM